MRSASNRLAHVPQPSGPPCPAAAAGLGTEQPIAPIPVPATAALTEELRSILGTGAASDIIDGDLTFQGKLTFQHDQPRITRIRNIDSTVIQPGHVAVIVERVTREDERGRPITVAQVRNMNATFSLEYVVNGGQLLQPGDEGPASLDSPIDAAYNEAFTPAIGETWGPTATDGRLNRNYFGFRIEGTPLNGRVRVVHEETLLLVGRADDNFVSDDIALVNVHVRNTGAVDSLVDTTWQVTAVSRQTLITQGSTVFCGRFHGIWYVMGTWGEGRQSGLLGQADEEILTDASGVVNIFNGIAGGEGDTGINVTAHNKFLGPIAAGDWVWLGHNNTGFYIISTEPAAGSTPTYAYGSLYGASDTVTGGGIGVYTKLTSLDTVQGSSSNTIVTAADNDIEIEVDGTYDVNFAASVASDSSAFTGIFRLFVNGVGHVPLSNNIYVHTSERRFVGFTGHIDLVAGDVLDVRMAAGSETANFANCQFTVELIEAAP
jgi:hypothetical protein